MSQHSQVSESLVVIRVSVKPLLQVSVLDHCELTKDPSLSKTCKIGRRSTLKFAFFTSVEMEQMQPKLRVGEMLLKSR